MKVLLFYAKGFETMEFSVFIDVTIEGLSLCTSSSLSDFGEEKCIITI